jgi:hypothetical protein
MYGLHIVVVNCAEAKPVRKKVDRSVVRIMIKYEVDGNVKSNEKQGMRIEILYDELVALSRCIAA